MSKRSRSSVVNDLIWDELLGEFDGEFHFTTDNNRRLMHAGGNFNVRVKKLDRGLRPRNILTQLVMDFLELGLTRSDRHPR
jgi:hypothetical protein